MKSAGTNLHANLSSVNCELNEVITTSVILRRLLYNLYAKMQKYKLYIIFMNLFKHKRTAGDTFKKLSCISMKL